MIFQTYAPIHPSLRSFVKTLWYIKQDDHELTGVEPRMLPDGCYHMVFNIGDPHHYMDNSGVVYSPKSSHMNAKQTETVKIQRNGKVEIMGAIFQPYGLFALLQVPVHEISGTVWNLDDLLGNTVRDIEERLMSGASVSGKFSLLESGLAALIKPHIRMNRAVLHAGHRIMERNGMIAIAELMEDLQCSERSLERHFKTHMGVTPKQFADIQRMQYILNKLRTSSDRLIQVAIEGNYYDQAHFNHTFKRMLGITPQHYLHHRDLLSDLYNTERRSSIKISNE